MGASASKPVEDDFQQRSKSIRKSSKKSRASLNKPDQIENIAKVIGNLKNEIDMFAGSRIDSRYKEFQKIMATLSDELQTIRKNSKKQPLTDRCVEVQGEIQNCFQRLETRVLMNEQNENSLDLASVESHSFIHSSNQRHPPPALLNKKWAEGLPPPNKSKHDAYNTSLEKIEQELQNLQREIKRSIELEDTKQCIIHENKIKILYTDLELIRVEEHTPLGERKSAAGKRLIKYNNLIKRFKINLGKVAKAQNTIQDGAGFSKPAMIEDQVDDFSKLEHLLSDLEIQALTFEGVKSDKKYKELEQTLESHWTRLYTMDAFGDEERKRRSITVERTKNILQELRKRAEENERQLKAIQAIHKIEQQFQGVKKEAEGFKGTTTDPTYIELDQDLRGLWAKLNDVEEPNEHVRRSKARVIHDLQYVLKNLSQNSKNAEIYQNLADIKKTNVEITLDDEINQKQLLKQVEEFQNHWNQLNYNLNTQKITKSEISFSIIDIFEKIEEGVGKKKNTLLKMEKRKSTSSLVIAKVIDNTDMLAKLQPTHIYHPAATTTVTSTENYYGHQKILTSFKPATYQSSYQPPDLIQQQAVSPPLAKPIETEIKAQPMVKVIGEMQRVSTEAKILLQQIRQSNCTKNDNEYKQFQSKLQQCQLTLQRIEYNKRSDTIESNRRRASKTINEALRALEEKQIMEQAAIRSSKAQEIMDIDAEIQYFRQQIKNFAGVTKDKQYEKIKQGLADSLIKLQVIDDIHMSKQESIRQIQQYHQELETKLAENQAKVKLSEKNAEIRRQTSHDIKGIVEQVQKLRSQVERFIGPYQGLLYKTIEGNLTGCLEKLESLDNRGDEKLQNGILLTKQKIQKYLRILEDKSTKLSNPEQDQEYNITNYSISVQPQNEEQENQEGGGSASMHQDVIHRKKIQRQSQVIESDSPHFQINFLRDKLVEVKNKTETFSGKYKDEEYSSIENQLLGYYHELKNIDPRGHKSIIISKEQYEDYIEKLLNYFEEKAKISEVQEEPEEPKINIVESQKFKIVDPTEELAVIEQKLLEMKSKIDGFEGTVDEPQYNELVHSLNCEMVKLEKVQAGNVAHVREKKRKLIQEIKNHIKFLSDKANSRQTFDEGKYQEQLQKINDVLSEIDEISVEINNFVGVKNDKEYCYLDELLIKYTIQLDNTETFGKSEIRDARKTAIRKIQHNMEVLTKRAAPKEDGAVMASNV